MVSIQEIGESGIFIWGGGVFILLQKLCIGKVNVILFINLFIRKNLVAKLLCATYGTGPCGFTLSVPACVRAHLLSRGQVKFGVRCEFCFSR